MEKIKIRKAINWQICRTRHKTRPNTGEKFDLIQKKGQSMNICFHIEENEWNGVKSIQLNIKDIRFCEDVQ